ncbi:MAG: hypothetical protein R2702_01095 [Acidimicrobiales bacterium]
MPTRRARRAAALTLPLPPSGNFWSDGARSGPVHARSSSWGGSRRGNG